VLLLQIAGGTIIIVIIRRRRTRTSTKGMRLLGKHGADGIVSPVTVNESRSSVRDVLRSTGSLRQVSFDDSRRIDCYVVRRVALFLLLPTFSCNERILMVIFSLYCTVLYC
jgi:hypothetical protein